MIIKTRSSRDKEALINSPIIMFLLKADQHLYNLLLLNALLDPIVYAVRIREVRVGYIRLFCQWRCCHKLPFIRNLHQQAYEESTHSHWTGRGQSFVFNPVHNGSVFMQSRSVVHKQKHYLPISNEPKKGNTTDETLL